MEPIWLRPKFRLLGLRPGDPPLARRVRIFIVMQNRVSGEKKLMFVCSKYFQASLIFANNARAYQSGYTFRWPGRVCKC
jgi:hypothetical protein